MDWIALRMGASCERRAGVHARSSLYEYEYELETILVGEPKTKDQGPRTKTRTRSDPGVLQPVNLQPCEDMANVSVAALIHGHATKGGKHEAE